MTTLGITNMLMTMFKRADTQVQTKPRDLMEFDRARKQQRKTLKAVDASSDVLSGLVRNMKGPLSPTSRTKRTKQ